MGYALAAWMAPFAVLVLFGGVLADRFSPRRMMVLADAVCLVAQGGLALTLATGSGKLWHSLVVQALSGAANALFQPGIASLVPRVTPDIQGANAVLRVGESLARIAGSAIGGILVAVAGRPSTGRRPRGRRKTGRALGRPADRQEPSHHDRRRDPTATS